MDDLKGDDHFVWHDPFRSISEPFVAAFAWPHGQLSVEVVPNTYVQMWWKIFRCDNWQGG